MLDLSALIAACVAAKRGSKEFALFYFHPDGDEAPVWRAEIGNPSSCVWLGETEGEYQGRGITAEEAVQALLAQLGGEIG